MLDAAARAFGVTAGAILHVKRLTARDYRRVIRRVCRPLEFGCGLCHCRQPDRAAKFEDQQVRGVEREAECLGARRMTQFTAQPAFAAIYCTPPII